MPANKPINTTIANLPTLTATEFAGERPINEEHIDNNVELINTFLEKLVYSIYSAGGKVSGTLTDASPIFTLAGFLGVTSDAETIVWCDEAYDLTGLGAGDGDYSLVVTAEGVLGTAFTFDFTDTQGVSETLTHQMNASFGKMALRSGSAGAGVQPEDVEVARLTLSGGTWTMSSEITTGPTPRLGSGVYQPLDSSLTSIATNTGTAADKGVYATGVDTFAEFDLTAAGRAILDDVDEAAQRTTLDVYSQSETDSAIDADIATHSADTTGVHGITDTDDLMLKVSSAADNKLVKLNADGTISNAGNDVYFEVDAQGLSFVPALSRSTTVVRIGSGAGASNVSGTSWTAIGNDAGFSNTTGTSWTAIGREAGASNTTGTSWTAIGREAGASNTTGTSWTAVGREAGASNTTGSSWTAIGREAAGNNETGTDWTAIGRDAGLYVGASGTTPNETCTAFFVVGNETRLSADGTTNENVIGNNAVGRGSNTLQIGSTAMTEIGLGDIAILVDTAPSSASDTGEVGMVAFDANYIYKCTATDTWKRVAIATW